jgi:hypothetical protein
VNKETLDFLDDFEGVKKGLYSCFEIEVIENITNTFKIARAYLLDNFKQTLLEPNTILFDDYHSLNEYYPEYISKKDFPNFDFNNYIKEIKESFLI